MRKFEMVDTPVERAKPRRWSRIAASSARRARRGAGLAEIVVVLTICGIVMAIAAPKLSTSYAGRASATAADRFVRTHELARATAGRYGRMTMLHIDAAGQRFWIDVDTSGAGTRATIGGIRSLKTEGVTLATSDTLLCFDARGLRSTRLTTCAQGSGTVTFSRETRTDVVAYTLLGKVLR